MEVQLTPDLQAKLDQLASATGRPQGEFVLDAMAGYFDEIEQVRGMLDSRYDDLKSGKVQLIDGEEVFSRLRPRAKHETALRGGSNSRLEGSRASCDVDVATQTAVTLGMEHAMATLSTTTPHPLSEIRASSAASYASVSGIERAIREDFATFPAVLGVLFAQDEGDIVVRLLVDRPDRDTRYRIYDKQASLIEAFPSFDLNFILVQTD